MGALLAVGATDLNEIDAGSDAAGDTVLLAVGEVLAEGGSEKKLADALAVGAADANEIVEGADAAGDTELSAVGEALAEGGCEKKLADGDAVGAPLPPPPPS